jgi:hypothetical protein
LEAAFQMAGHPGKKFPFDNIFGVGNGIFVDCQALNQLNCFIADRPGDT